VVRTDQAIPVAGSRAATEHHPVRRRTALLVLTAAACLEMVSIWRFRIAEAHRWSVLSALAAILIVAAVLDIVLSVALRDTDS
jgi:hypothetical protein